MTRQADHPCACGSWWADGENCAKCGEPLFTPEDFYRDDRFSRKRKAPRGQDWDKKQHKVIWR
jgi:rRNA maturation protein Nop10